MNTITIVGCVLAYFIVGGAVTAVASFISRLENPFSSLLDVDEGFIPAVVLWPLIAVFLMVLGVYHLVLWVMNGIYRLCTARERMREEAARLERLPTDSSAYHAQIQ